jgi:alkylated DNA repair dioxygenase AlkB
MNKIEPIYIKDFVKNSAEVFKSLYKDLDWFRYGNTPRKEYYCNDHDVPYTYGSGAFARTYYKKPYTKEILNIRNDLERELNSVLDVCFLNCYEDFSDHLGWHADDSPEMDMERPIISVSLGSERFIWVKEKGGTEVSKFLLESGSAFIMPAGMQKTHLHRIPKNDRPCGPRISLTFRGFVKN